MQGVLLYHADADANRGLAVATIIALGLLALFTLWLIAIAPRQPGRSRRAAVAAIGLTTVGGAALLAMWAIPWSDAEDEPPILWWALFTVVAGAFLIAPGPAFAAFFRQEGRLAAVAIGLSLVFPSLLIAGLFACAIMQACFH